MITMSPTKQQKEPTLKCPTCGHKITRCPACRSKRLVSFEWESDDFPEDDPSNVPVQMWKCRDCGTVFDENLNQELLDS